MAIETPTDLLSKHKIMKKAIPEAVKLVDEIDQDPLAVDPKWSREIDEYEYYILRVGYALVQLLYTCKNLCHAILYLSSFKPTNRQKRGGITRQSHIQYHIESFIIRTNSLYDRVLGVVEGVFHLGINSENLNHTIIISNVHVKHTDVPKRLKALRKVIKQYQESRNAIIHRELYTDKKLRRLQLLYLPEVEESFLYGESGPPDRFINIRRMVLRDTIKEKTNEFYKFTDTAFERIKELLDELDVVYEKKAESFNKRYKSK